MKLNVLVLSLFIVPILGFSQDSSQVEDVEVIEYSMVTNRPGATEASKAVYHKGFQMEVGFEFGHIPERKGSDKHTQYIYLPQFNLQYGVSKNVELRVSSSNYATREQVNDGYTKFNYNLDNIVVGAKINLFKPKKWVPEMALLVTQSFPSNYDNYRKYWPTTVLLAWGYSLPKNFSLAGNIGYVHEKVSFDNHIEDGHSWKYTVNLGYAIKHNMGVFAEIFGSDTFNDALKTPLTLDGGVWYRFNPQLQIDASTGYGFDVGSYYINAGFSWLIIN